MPRPAPADLDYAPVQAKTFAGNTNVDLTNQFPLPSNPAGTPPSAPFSGEYCHAATLLVVTSVTAGNLIVRMQADPATDVSILFPAATQLDIRGAFVALRAGGAADMSITAFWQGGPC